MKLEKEMNVPLTAEEVRELLERYQKTTNESQSFSDCGTDNDEILVFKKDNVITDSRLNRIYVRQSYRILFEKLATARRHCLLLGTPGIGKSHAIFYFLHRILNDRNDSRWDNVTIVVVSKNLKEYVIYSKVVRPPSVTVQCTVDKGNSTSVSYEKLDSVNTLFIFDAVSPPFSEIKLGRIWLITSPQVSVHGQFSKHCLPVPDRFLMPVFSLSELLKMVCLYKHITADTVLERYANWGGSARFVFEWNSIQEQVILANDVKLILSSYNLVAELESVYVRYSAPSLTGYPRPSCHEVFHMMSSDFSALNSRVVLASASIARKALESIFKISQSEVDKLTRSLMSVRGYGTTPSFFFEVHSCRHLFFNYVKDVQKKIILIPLNGQNEAIPAETTLRLNKTELIGFKNETISDQLDSALHSVLYPTERNYATFDFITVEEELSHETVPMRVISLWQMTTAKISAHNLSAENLKTIFQNFPNHVIRFIWVLPEVHSSEEPVLKNITSGTFLVDERQRFNEMVQYVTYIPDTNYLSYISENVPPPEAPFDVNNHNQLER